MWISPAAIGGSSKPSRAVLVPAKSRPIWLRMMNPTIGSVMSSCARTLMRTTMAEDGSRQMDGMSGEIEHGDPDDFGAAVAKTMVDVRDGIDDFRRLHRSVRDPLGLAMQRGEIGAVFFKHRGQVAIHYVFRAAKLAHASSIHPESAIADGLTSPTECVTKRMVTPFSRSSFTLRMHRWWK